MREFTQHILAAFYGATGWTEDNNYSELNATANELLNFPVPTGLRLTLSSLATPHFATSYHLGSVGVVDGSIAYLYSSIPLANVTAQSDRMPLAALFRSYRQLKELPRPPLLSSRWASSRWASGSVFGSFITTSVSSQLDTSGQSPDADAVGRTAARARGALLYGRLYLPHSSLEGLVIKRLSQALQMQLCAVSDASLRNGGTILGLLQYDEGKFGVEGLASTDGGLLGLRSVYNWGGDASSPDVIAAPPMTGNEPPNGGSLATADRERERIYGRFSAGAELYYGTLNKSGGMSLGARFATLPAHRGTPLTATLTINPLMGSISASYSVVARRYCSLATKLDFNVYSYESDWAVGMELWSTGRPGPSVAEEATGPVEARDLDRGLIVKERSFQAKLEWRLDDSSEPGSAALQESAMAHNGGGHEDSEEEYLGVLKARVDQNMKIGLLWEGRVKSLLFSLGSGIDLRRLDSPFRTLGLAIQYSS